MKIIKTSTKFSNKKSTAYTILTMYLYFKKPKLCHISSWTKTQSPLFISPSISVIHPTLDSHPLSQQFLKIRFLPTTKFRVRCTDILHSSLQVLRPSHCLCPSPTLHFCRPDQGPYPHLTHPLFCRWKHRSTNLPDSPIIPAQLYLFLRDRTCLDVPPLNPPFSTSTGATSWLDTIPQS